MAFSQIDKVRVCGSKNQKPPVSESLWRHRTHLIRCNQLPLNLVAQKSGHSGRAQGARLVSVPRVSAGVGGPKTASVPHLGPRSWLFPPPGPSVSARSLHSLVLPELLCVTADFREREGRSSEASQDPHLARPDVVGGRFLLLGRVMGGTAGGPSYRRHQRSPGRCQSNGRQSVLREPIS